MSKILAIDYGTKRCGIAVTDDAKIIASGLTTVSPATLMDWLKRYTTHEEIDSFVIGLPLRLHGEPSEVEQEIKLFITKLALAFPSVPIHRIDERFTSKLALNSLLYTGASKKKRRNKALLDQISATIILQDFLKKN